MTAATGDTRRPPHTTATRRDGVLDLVAEVLDATAVLRGAVVACRGRADLFEPPESREPRARVAARHRSALALCERCPALAACREWADHEPAGRWQGWVVGGVELPPPPPPRRRHPRRRA